MLTLKTGAPPGHQRGHGELAQDDVVRGQERAHVLVDTRAAVAQYQAQQRRYALGARAIFCRSSQAGLAAGSFLPSNVLPAVFPGLTTALNLLLRALSSIFQPEQP